jgi:exonuclease SbcC
LAQEEKLRAYAKVIQSFSKAKTLNLQQSNSLKDFLFENTEDGNVSLFEQKKNEINQQLLYYKEQHELIKDLEKKQAYLEDLRTLHDKQRQEYLTWRTAALVHNYQQFVVIERDYSAKQKALAEVVAQKADLEEKKAALEAQYQSTAQEYEQADKDFTALQEYKNTLRELKEKLDKIDELTKNSTKREQENRDLQEQIAEHTQTLQQIKQELPQLEEQIKQLATAKDALQQDLQRIAHSRYFYEQYGTFESVKAAYQNMHDQKNALQQQWTAETNRLTYLKNLFENINEQQQSFFQSVIRHKKALSLAQESLLFHKSFYQLSTEITKPKYVYDTSQLLDEQHYEPTEGGFWLRLGGIAEFIAYREVQYFDKPENFEAVLHSQKSEIKTQLDYLAQQLDLLAQIDTTKHHEKVQAFAQQYGLDIQLLQLSKLQVDNLQEAFELVQNEVAISEKFNKTKANYENSIAHKTRQQEQQNKLMVENTTFRTSIDTNQQGIERNKREISHLRGEETNLKVTLQFHKEQISFDFQQDELDRKIVEITRKKEIASETTKDFTQRITTIQAQIAPLAREEGSLGTAVQLLTENFERTRTAWERAYKEFLEDFEAQTVDVEQAETVTAAQVENIQKNFLQIYTRYKDKYKDVLRLFPDIANNEFLQEQLQNETYNYKSILDTLISGRTATEIPEMLGKANEERRKLAATLKSQLWEIFHHTKEQYKKCRDLVNELNNFFKGKKISNNFYFELVFTPAKNLNIEWISQLHGELNEGFFAKIDDKDYQPDNYVFEVFKKLQGYTGSVLSTKDLLNPKKYFELSTKLTDDSGQTISGSNSQGYAAVALLCIGRLSIIEINKSGKGKGIKFIILEEVGSMSDDNFGMFVKVSQEFGYQIITMTPKPYGYFENMEWYLYELYGKKDGLANYPPLATFKLIENGEERSEELRRLQLLG